MSNWPKKISNFIILKCYTLAVEHGVVSHLGVVPVPLLPALIEVFGILQNFSTYTIKYESSNQGTQKYIYCHCQKQNYEWTFSLVNCQFLACFPLTSTPDLSPNLFLALRLLPSLLYDYILAQSSLSQLEAVQWTDPNDKMKNNKKIFEYLIFILTYLVELFWWRSNRLLTEISVWWSQSLSLPTFSAPPELGPFVELLCMILECCSRSLMAWADLLTS